ncbi:MAG: site-specific integrase [Marinobacter sp.]|uniref:site-specific integrase n=1 Tax=Marinobacter sp. TaxID=50741 RepID=UPI00299CE064|nr:site-specific integrase [Marinobacter sp.]MDX1635791.1 site-specific integrase [Marinobacter sp.]
MNITEALEHSQPGLLVRVTQAMQKHQLNQRTEQTYLHWITRFVLYSGLKAPEALEGDDQQRFLTYLKDRIRVSRARLNQAHQALEFFYQDVLEKREVATAVA